MTKAAVNPQQVLIRAYADLAERNGAQAERIAELEAGLGHIIRWCEQDSDMLTFYQILISVTNMCHDTLGTKDSDEVDHPLAEQLATGHA